MIAKAAKLLERGDTAGAVGQLGKAWAETPSSRIAKLAVALSARLPVEALPAKVREREAQWQTLAKTRNPRKLPTLLAADWPVHPREARARAEALVAFPPDPRIAHAFHTLWTAQRYLSNPGIVMWRIVLRTLLAWRDPEVAVMIRTASRALSNQRVAVEMYAKDALPGEPALAADDERIIDVLEARVAAATPQLTDTSALFAAVYDDPASDAPRMVLADALLANGDLRGELIQLQLAPPSAKSNARIKALLRAHQATWLGSFDEVVGNAVFRRGFAADVSVDGRQELHPERREWCTVEVIHIQFPMGPAYDAALARFLAHDNLAGLRRCDGISVRALDQIARDFEQLDVVPPLVPTRTRTTARVLGIHGTYNPRVALPDILAWFDASPFREVERLELGRFPDDLPAVWAWFWRSHVGTVVLRPRLMLDEAMAWELALDRGAHLVATWHGNIFGERDPTGLGEVLEALPANALTSLTVRSGVRINKTVEKLLAADILRGLRRHRQLRDVTMF